MVFYTTKNVNNLIKEEYLNYIGLHYTDILENPNKYIKFSENAISDILGGEVRLLNSGTTALQLGLLTLGVNKGDEVILPANTYSATAIAITNIGATPVFCDINLQNYTIDVRDLSKKITNKTKVIIPVHLYGYPCDMENIMRIAKEKNIFVIEDASHAFGGKIDGKFLGTIGDIGIFSAHVSKNFGTLGNGGILFSKNRKVFENLENYIFPDKGFPEVLFSGRTPANISAFDAIVLFLKIKYLDHIKKYNLSLFKKYLELLAKNPDIISIPNVDSDDLFIRNFTCLIKNREKYIQGGKGRIYYDLNLSDANIFGSELDYDLKNTKYFFEHNFSFNFYYGL